MRVLVLNGSPRPKGNTKQMVDAFREGAESVGHRVDVIDVFYSVIVIRPDVFESQITDKRHFGIYEEAEWFIVD